ncbi:hypothetical protein [Oleiharenicola sp. Vm1]|uniref:hypothetical protein n=1 Tax=Oleiharenicola sp. Vm1 TaxID=3398393 RepID=UPI0039F56249
MKPECLFSVTLRDEELTTFVVIAQSEDAAISVLKESGTAERDQVGRVDMLASSKPCPPALPVCWNRGRAF